MRSDQQSALSGQGMADRSQLLTFRRFDVLTFSLCLCASVVHADLAGFRCCTSGSSVPQSVDWCRYRYDLDGDGDVDMDDWGAIQRGETHGECACSTIVGLDGAVMLGAIWEPLPPEVLAQYTLLQANVDVAFEYDEKTLLPEGECVSYDCGPLTLATRWRFGPLVEARIADLCSYLEWRIEN